MNTFLEQPVVQAVGWSLVQSLWQGSVVALLLAGVNPLLRKNSARMRYALGCLALLLAVAWPLATLLKATVWSGASPWAVSAPWQGLADAPLDPAIPLKSQGLGADAWPWGLSWAWSARLGPWLEPVLPWLVVGWLLGVRPNRVGSPPRVRR